MVDYEKIRQDTLEFCNDIFILNEDMKKRLDNNYYMVKSYHNRIKKLGESIDSIDEFEKLLEITKDFSVKIEDMTLDLKDLNNKLKNRNIEIDGD